MMARSTNRKILKPNVILCEGRDAQEFLISFLNHADSEKSEFLKNDIQVFDFGGNEELQNFVGTLKKMEDFHQIKSMLIVRDAETDATKAEGDICATLEAMELPVPEGACSWKRGEISTAYVLFPSCDENPVNGTLEDLCIKILSEVENETIVKEISGFIEKLREEGLRSFPHEFKTKLHTYFSVTDKYISFKIGEAAKAGAFSWNDEKLLPLKQCIEKMSI